MIRRHHHIARTSDSLLNPLRLWYSFLMPLPTLFLLEMATSACCSVIHSRLTEICSYLMECRVILSFHGPRRMHHDDFGDGMTFHLADLSKFYLSNEVYQLGNKVLVGWIWWRLVTAWGWHFQFSLCVLTTIWWISKKSGTDIPVVHSMNFNIFGEPLKFSSCTTINVLTVNYFCL